jgi:hypothetical protein
LTDYRAWGLIEYEIKKKDSNVDRDGREEMSWIGMSKEEGKYK